MTRSFLFYPQQGLENCLLSAHQNKCYNCRKSGGPLDPCHSARRAARSSLPPAHCRHGESARSGGGTAKAACRNWPDDEGCTTNCNSFQHPPPPNNSFLLCPKFQVLPQKKGPLLSCFGNVGGGYAKHKSKPTITIVFVPDGFLICSLGEQFATCSCPSRTGQTLFNTVWFYWIPGASPL